MAAATSIEKRLHPRFFVAHEVLISCGHETLRTCTLNLSFSGMHVEVDLPEHMKGKVLDVVLVLYERERKVYLNLRALSIGRFIASGRLQFINYLNDTDRKLRELMDLYKKASHSL